MPLKQEYEVHLNLFEGPLDLLLYLVNKAEIDITEIRVSEIVQQYLAYLDVIRDLNIDVASEYLHMAAVLIRLKARELLPPMEGEDPLGDEDGIYNRDQLIQQLIEYKKFKEAAGTLKVFESEQYGAFTRGAAEQIESSDENEEVYIGNISVFDLLTAFKKILERVNTEDYRHVVVVDNCRIDDRIEFIIGTLTEHEEVPFEQLFEGDLRKIVVVVTFMAILELVKMQEIYFRQEENFGKIFVKKRVVKEALPSVTPEELQTIEQPDDTDSEEPKEDGLENEIEEVGNEQNATKEDESSGDADSDQ